MSIFIINDADPHKASLMVKIISVSTLLDFLFVLKLASINIEIYFSQNFEDKKVV